MARGSGATGWREAAGAARDSGEMWRRRWRIRARKVKLPWCQDAGEIDEPTKRGREPIDMAKSARTLQDPAKKIGGQPILQDQFGAEKMTSSTKLAVILPDDLFSGTC